MRIIVLCPGLTEANHEDFRSDLITDSRVSQKYQPQRCVHTSVRDFYDLFFHGFFTIRVESVAHGLIYAIRCAQNGSIWISEQGKPVYEVQPSDSLPQKTDRAEEQRS